MARHEAQNEAILDQFTKQAAPYAKLTASLAGSGRGESALFEALRPLPTDTVLDVACGTGSLSLALARLTRHVTGIDLTAAMIDQARALQAKAGVTNVTWQLGDVFPLPFPDGAYSLVVSKAAFHHLVDPAAVLAEMARVCSRDGRIAVYDLGPDPDKADAFNRVEKLRDPSHVRALTPAELRSLGKPIGLVETAVWSQPTQQIPLEAILATSFPEPGDIDKVRALYRADAQSGANTLGLRAELAGEQIMIQYPMTMVVWQPEAVSCAA
jgi:ubiquinone/menaquinone biosynthesis C-methylase UbiE